MPTTKSAAKRLRQNIVRRTRNRAATRDLRTRCKRVAAAVAEENLAEAEAELRITAKKLDQAAAKGVIHRNAAARLKSRLSARVKAAKAQAAPET
jgi:small subunit ribosomal protein S20